MKFFSTYPPQLICALYDAIRLKGSLRYIRMSRLTMPDKYSRTGKGGSVLSVRFANVRDVPQYGWVPYHRKATTKEAFVVATGLGRLGRLVRMSFTRRFANPTSPTNPIRVLQLASGGGGGARS